MLEAWVSKNEITADEWVVVCDGRKALILENKGDAKFPNLRAKESYEHPDLPTHQQGTSPPGRSHQSVGPARSAVSQTDWHDQAERAFLTSLAVRLDKAVATGETKAIAVIAPPRALVYSANIIPQRFVRRSPKKLEKIWSKRQST
jgi:protein required for attachment to host cells